MKRISQLIYIFLTVTSCSTKTFLIENDLNLKGRVKSIEENKYIASNNIKIETNIFHFDNNGNILLKEQFNSSGKVEKKFEYEYDYSNLTFKEIEYKNESNRNVYSISIYKIGKNEKITSAIHKLKNGKVLFSQETKYDSNNNKIEELEIEGNIKTLIKWKNKYAKNQLIEKREFYNNSPNFKKYLYKYNDEGKILSKKLINELGKTISDDKFEYDEFGNIKSYSYNSKKTTYIYEYDKKYNWIKKIEFKNDKPMIITLRTIKY